MCVYMGILPPFKNYLINRSANCIRNLAFKAVPWSRSLFYLHLINVEKRDRESILLDENLEKNYLIM